MSINLDAYHPALFIIGIAYIVTALSNTPNALRLSIDYAINKVFLGGKWFVGKVDFRYLVIGTVYVGASVAFPVDSAVNEVRLEKEISFGAELIETRMPSWRHEFVGY